MCGDKQRRAKEEFNEAILSRAARFEGIPAGAGEPAEWWVYGKTGNIVAYIKREQGFFGPRGYEVELRISLPRGRMYYNPKDGRKLIDLIEAYCRAAQGKSLAIYS